MTLTLSVDPTWLSHPEALGRILGHIRALESPAPWSPPVGRESGQDDDLSELLAGIDTPEPAPAAPVPPRPPAPQPSPSMPRFSGEPATGQSLYKWACQSKVLPRVNAIGKARGWHKLVTHWDADQVREAYRELTTAEPAANGRPR
jgi:hypothetical protein